MGGTHVALHRDSTVLKSVFGANLYRPHGFRSNKKHIFLSVWCVLLRRPLPRARSSVWCSVMQPRGKRVLCEKTKRLGAKLKRDAERREDNDSERYQPAVFSGHSESFGGLVGMLGL